MNDPHDGEEAAGRSFAGELRRLRLQAGLSVRRLARELHRAHSAIVEYESAAGGLLRPRRGLPRLAAGIVAHQTLIGPMAVADLRRAIELPAAKAGLLLQPGLVETMLDDLAGEPGALPLLSHALLETWKRRRHRHICP